MKALYKKILPLILSFNILIVSFFSCSLSVYAGVTIPDDYVAPDIIAAVELSIEQKNYRYFVNYLYDTADGLIFLLSQMGAVVTLDFPKWVENNKALESLVDITPVKKEDDNIVFTKELFEELKKILDEYVKTEQTKEENGGFYLLPTTKCDDVPLSSFVHFSQYKTFMNIVAEKGVLPVVPKYRNFTMVFFDPFSDPEHPKLLVGNKTYLDSLETGKDVFVESRLYCAYDWKYEKSPVMTFSDTSIVYDSCSDGISYEKAYNADFYYDSAFINYDYERPGSISNAFILCSTSGERMRVFVSQEAAQNYSVGNRKIYFSENYYNYVPEDLTVSIDDLQKSVDDLQKIIDELLKKINDQTSEKEIEELLRQILEEIRKNPGGGGSGSGSGDVTVSVDLKETNSWLSKIYTRLGDILAKISESAENAGQTALDGIQSRLDEISETLKKIKNWTIADTVIDAADAVADWLDLVRDLLKDAEAGAGAVVSSLSSALGNSAGILSSKFPFCVPWDIFAIVSFLRAEPEAPHFKLPIILERYGIESYIEIDMEPFQVVSDISRTMLALLYAYGLVMLTGKVIDIGKEVP